MLSCAPSRLTHVRSQTTAEQAIGEHEYRCCNLCEVQKWTGGLWRSLAAHYTGGVGVAGSNPVSPTSSPSLRGWAFRLSADSQDMWVFRGVSPYLTLYTSREVGGGRGKNRLDLLRGDRRSDWGKRNGSG